MRVDTKALDHLTPRRLVGFYRKMFFDSFQQGYCNAWGCVRFGEHFWGLLVKMLHIQMLLKYTCAFAGLLVCLVFSRNPSCAMLARRCVVLACDGAMFRHFGVKIANKGAEMRSVTGMGAAKETCPVSGKCVFGGPVDRLLVSVEKKPYEESNF